MHTAETHTIPESIDKSQIVQTIEHVLLSANERGEITDQNNIQFLVFTVAERYPAYVNPDELFQNISWNTTEIFVGEFKVADYERIEPGALKLSNWNSDAFRVGLEPFIK